MMYDVGPWMSIQGQGRLEERRGIYTNRVPIACVRALLEFETMADPETQERFVRWAVEMGVTSDSRSTWP